MKQNLSLRVWGNLKIITVLFALPLLMASCSWFKPAQDSKKEKVYKEDDIGDIQGKKVFDPETGTWRTVREVSGKVDTVRWKELSPDRFPPITSDGSWAAANNPNTNTGTNTSTNTNTSGSGKNYNLALMLPFMAQGFNSTAIDENSMWGIQFYAGAKIAYEALQRDGASLNISVLDTDGTASKTTSLLRSADLLRSDLVIGPYKRENVALAADFAKQNKKPLIVPYNAQMGTVENNPFYIQVNPSLKSHCVAITKHIRKSYSTEDVVLVGRDKDGEKDRLFLFQDANAQIEGRSTGTKFREMIVTDATSDFRKMDVSPYIRRGRTTVFVVPSWSNESFVYSLLRQLMVKQSEGEDIVVYGMPQWMGFEQIDYEFYEKLKVHVSNAFYVDKDDERIRQFNQLFFNAYGTIPAEEAYIGHDIMLYFGRMINRWGPDFYTRIDQEPFDVLHGRFQFNRIVLDPQKSRENLNYYDQLENTFVHILKFQDYHFQPAN